MFSSCCGCGNKKASLKVANDEDENGEPAADASDCDSKECNDGGNASRPDYVTNGHDKNGSPSQQSTSSNNRMLTNTINHNEAATAAVTNDTDQTINDVVNGKDHQPPLAAVENEENYSDKQINHNSKCRKLSDSSNSTVIELVKIPSNKSIVQKAEEQHSQQVDEPGTHSQCEERRIEPPPQPTEVEVEEAEVYDEASESDSLPPPPPIPQSPPSSLIEMRRKPSATSVSNSTTGTSESSQRRCLSQQQQQQQQPPSPSPPQQQDSQISNSLSHSKAADVVLSNGDDNLPSPPPKCEDYEEEATINDFDDDEHQLQDDLIDECLSNGAHGNDAPKSCMSSRRSSSKSSIKKRVNYSESQEIIPPPPLLDDAAIAIALKNGNYNYCEEIDAKTNTAILDDDEVFSDSVPAKFLRGDMCTPYPKKRSSIPGVFALPDWFADDREIGGILEPPVTPVGRDELAMKRHRFFSELLNAAQHAAEHRIRFDPFGPNVADCPELKAATTTELSALINRLERVCERLERFVSARTLAIANEQLNTATANPDNKRNSDEIDNLPLPSLPTTPGSTAVHSSSATLEPNDSDHLRQNTIDQYSDLATPTPPPLAASAAADDFELNIPTVIQQIENSIYLSQQSPADYTPPKTMSVYGFQDILNGPFAQYLQLSAKIGGDVAKHADFVKQAFDAQLNYVTLASTSSKPAQARQAELLKPTSDQISAIQGFREKNRSSPFFNHLSAISESIPALGWVCVSPTPGPHVKEMNDAGQFYTNRVLKDWKEKDAKHVEWARAWVQTLTELQAYIKQYHTTGLVWSGKTEAIAPVRAGGAPPPPPPGCPPPPPVLPPFDDLSLGGDDERSALFAQINQGEDITKHLKRVTADMQTHKNTALRSGPAPFKAPTAQSPGTKPVGPAAAKAPVFTRDGKKWLIEHQRSNPNLIVEDAEMNNVVYVFKCENSTITVKGKINSIFLDSCKKCSVLFDAVVSSVEFVNCQSVQMQVLGHVPTISIDKTDGCQMYLSDESKNVEIVSSKSSEMNVLLPKANGDYTELPIPEQFKTTIKGNSLSTICVESLG